ncbi:purine or other phosphorylase family 1 [Pseudopedobacter saltans DSM 12145]|uniref:Uridine phosphorylase n=1 Tax=Pseudopedobacter saltans (strain ATCC 51119 / DSM 12145 / JCM 21818 / CCUG 39354 / LMG 10337 / NBRC 100064 / NCIMB 13643) TaxID=762903 RepID=F0SA98_PSESL|nr:nucleoside phosphorylase [Pseudopedobacter saltans]ADY51475.1 purine or other phosphorylase family 1 [Pseudopedobacter saltans DSM 12145]
MNKISETDLILNPDGSVYHLNLLPEDIGNIVFTVGDPERVSEVSKHFDFISVKKFNREFVTHTGYLRDKKVSVISTGIGTDNIDIVLNELDALVNIDLESRTVKNELTVLQIIRLGTSGTIREDIPVGTILASTHGLGLDSLMNFYHRNLTGDELLLENNLNNYFENEDLVPYITAGSGKLLDKLCFDLEKGITVSAPGFYAPQGRAVRAEGSVQNLMKKLSNYEFEGHIITNLEMETAGIYALANTLGHKAVSVNAIVANRLKSEFAPNAQQIINEMIEKILSRI